MLAQTRTPALVLASACFLLGLLLGSALPIWTAWHFSSWEGVGERVSLWGALLRFPPTVEHFGFSKQLLDLYLGDLITGVFVVGFATAIGGLVYWMNQPRRARATDPTP